MIRLPRRQSRPRLCPHLGLAADPFKHYPNANEQHRCYANLGRERIDLGHQRRFCLASCYSRCPFLTVQETGRLERIWAWVRAVSPVPQARVGDPRRPTWSPWGSPRPASFVAGARLAWALAVQVSRLLVALAWSAYVAAAERVASWQTARRARAEAAVAQPAPIAEAPVDEAEVTSVMADATPVVHRIALPMWEEPVEVVQIEQPADLVEQPADLVESGISALEAGDEPAAYALFKRATRSDRKDARAWFWRAKTAESLDEVITCLEKAHALDPGNSQIKANLDSATQRREQARSAAKAAAKAKSSEAKAAAARWNRRGPRRVAVVGSSICDLMRTLTAVAAFSVGAAWLLSGLPVEVRQAVTAAGGLGALPVPDATSVFARLPISFPVLEGYPTASALPYGLGFLVEFVGVGLLSGDRWTRVWAPLVGIGSAWLWLQAPAAISSPLVLAACVLTASGGVLAQRAPRSQPGHQQVTFA